ncbi:transient receptor potential cation channel subfamily V member 5 [Brachionus plicatilis]|uniref:Transient receptor potential cation channel subfamily V member 5 n=1 Tax=Brachionus plicatilis TaxID=10195 RepID=A0A3M7PLX9_BRAPC|nr:transient receptor potential cation channel subfamily V member 5 [Brachionus plicatilis]
MGNANSDVNDSLKAQADSENGPDIYKLLNVNGGGELVRLMKIAIAKKDFTELDNFIKTEVVKYLYNEGKGEHIPIERIVSRKRSEKNFKSLSNLTSLMGKSKMNHDLYLSDYGFVYYLESKRKINVKEICFQIDKCGAVGESLLHLCMLNGTTLCHELAKILIKHFPKMVNDFYLNEDYYGETALHMAIVSEEPSMVRFLLANGADVHARCCGKFFCPDDQKNNQEHSILHDVLMVPENTNYEGYIYYGEYPLSFAAVLNQKECVRLLIASGADPNKQDFNGNTVLHMLVIKNNLPMFKFMLNFKTSLKIKNRQGLTPLTLAAKLARKEIFQFILEKLRHVWFTYADISYGSYPLETIDTISNSGAIDTTSALYLITNGKTDDHLELLEGFIVDLINKKWSSYIKHKFYFEFFFYIIYLVISIFVIWMEREYFDYLDLNLNCAAPNRTSSNLKKKCACAYLNPNDSKRFTRIVFEIILTIYSIIYIVIMGCEFYIQKFSSYIKSLLLNPSKIFFVFSLICTLLIIPMRFSCLPEGEDFLLVTSTLFKSVYILYLGRGFRVISTFIFVIHKSLQTNFFRFIIIFGVFMIGFSQSFYVALNFGISTHHHVFTTPLISIFDLFVMYLHDLDEIYIDIMQSKYQILGIILFVIFLILVSILLVNLFIAMMARTYNTTTELKREWLRQWTKQVLTIEKNVSLKKRLKFQNKYAHTLRNGEKAFSVRWKQTEEERNQIKASKHIFREYIKQVFNTREMARDV